jgi:YVTN family beta-propeller protein
MIGSPITVGKEPAGVAIDPSGKVAYVASPADGTLTPIDTSLDSILSPQISGFPGATGIAFGPVGLKAYVTNEKEKSVTVLDATRNVAAGTIPAGESPNGVAVVPDQGPNASFFISPTRKRAKKRLTFHGGGSSDPDGKIANYAWDFGDGGHAEGDKATRVHKYKKPGEYLVTLVVTDDEGCSTETVFTGQTATCNGSSAAAYQSLITVVDATGPVLQLGGGRQRLRGRVFVFARCPREPCTFRARGFVVTKFEGIGGLHRGRSRLGGASVSRPSRGWRRLALRVPKRARRAALRALLRGGKAKARVSVLATDLSGDQTLRTRTIKLALPRR